MNLFRCNGVLGFLVFVSWSGFAYANCPSQDMEGIYANQRGDRFQIEQPTCDLTVVTDIQQNKKFEIQMTGSINDLSRSTLTNIKDHLTKFPVTYTVDRSKWNDGQTNLTFNTELKLKNNHYGLRNPSLQADLYVTREVDESGKLWGISIRTQDFRASLGDNPSALEETLVKGINIGFSIMKKLGHRHFGYSEWLVKVQ